MEEDLIKTLILAKPLFASIDSVIARYSCIKFARFLLDEAIVSRGDYLNLIKVIKKTSPNAKGYDIDYTKPNGDHIIAELKCYTPVNGQEFGGTQKTAIEKDINGLKSLSKIKAKKPNNTLRFFAMLCIDNNPQKAFASLNRSKKWRVLRYKSGITPKTTTIYSVFLNI